MRTRVLSGSLAAVVVLSAIVALGCGPKKDDGGGGTPTPTPTVTIGPGARVLSISAAPAHMPTPSTQDFIDAATLAHDAGCRGNFLSYTWSSLEPSAGNLDVTKVINEVNGAVNNGATTVYVAIQMINTTAKETPSDLQAVAFDDSSMMARFHAVVDALAPSLAGKVQYFGIGNEVDPYLASTNQWAPFKTFFDDGAAYVKSKIPGVQVGTTFTFGGANAHTAQMNTLTANADVMIFTDYPLGANFVPLAPSHGADDLDAMVSLAGGKKVIVQEFGYPADATVLGSSEQQQADFITSGLVEWAALGGDKIPFLNVFLMHDFSSGMCDQFAQYYGDPNDANFKAYLCSIGLRANDGTPKTAWNAFVQAAAATGLP